MKQKKEINFLDLIPVKNCQWDKSGDGTFYLQIPRFKNRWMRKFAMGLGRSEFQKITLDAIGSKVWSLIDGSITVEEIGRQMEQENGEPLPQVYQRLTKFLAILSRNKLISYKNY